MPKLNINHQGEEPRGKVLDKGKAWAVELFDYRNDPYKAMYRFIVGTWGLDPDDPIPWDPDLQFCQDAIIEAVNGRALPLALEIPAYTFTMKGISRIDTHQTVRQRVGVTFSQQCTGDNDIRHYDMLLPLTEFDRMIAFHQGREDHDKARALEQIKQLVAANVSNAMELYGRALDLGMSPNDCRLWTPECKSTYLHMNISLLALSSFLGRRQCENQPLCGMGLEMAKMVEKVHPVFAPLLRPNCDRRGVCGERALNHQFGAAIHYPCGRHPRPGKDASETTVFDDDYCTRGTAAFYRGEAILPGAKLMVSAETRTPEELEEVAKAYDTSIKRPDRTNALFGFEG